MVKKIDDWKIRELYTIKNKSGPEIGRLLGCNSTTVYKRLAGQGIKRRTLSESLKGRKLNEQQKKNMFGRIPWNKGLTKETNESVRRYSINSRKTKLENSTLKISICKICQHEFKHHGIRKYCSKECYLKDVKNILNKGRFIKGNESPFKKHLTEEDIKIIIKLYTQNKLSLRNIAKQIHCSSFVIIRILKENNIHIRNISESRNGKTYEDLYSEEKAKELKKRLSERMKGENSPLYGRECSGKNNSFFGKKHSEKTRKKISEKNKGHTPWNKGKDFMKLEKNPAWKGGISFEPYGLKFNAELKEQIRKKYYYRCQQCFRHQDELGYKIPVHHIDYNKQNNESSNLIPLCKTCHTQTNFKREDWINYFKNKVEI